MNQLSTIKAFGALVSQATGLGLKEVKLPREKAVELLYEINLLLAEVVEQRSTQSTASVSLDGGKFDQS